MNKKKAILDIIKNCKKREKILADDQYRIIIEKTELRETIRKFKGELIMERKALNNITNWSLGVDFSGYFSISAEVDIYNTRGFKTIIEPDFSYDNSIPLYGYELTLSPYLCKGVSIRGDSKELFRFIKEQKLKVSFEDIDFFIESLEEFKKEIKNEKTQKA